MMTVVLFVWTELQNLNTLHWNYKLSKNIANKNAETNNFSHKHHVNSPTHYMSRWTVWPSMPLELISRSPSMLLGTQIWLHSPRCRTRSRWCLGGRESEHCSVRKKGWPLRTIKCCRSISLVRWARLFSLLLRSTSIMKPNGVKTQTVGVDCLGSIVKQNEILLFASANR